MKNIFSPTILDLMKSYSMACDKTRKVSQIGR